MNCILHIGTEKTGSSTIQEFLYSNFKSLRSQGVGLSRSLGSPNNRKLSAYVQSRFDDYFQIRGIATERAKREHFRDFDSAFDQELKKLASENIECLIITSEHLQSRLTKLDEIERLRTFLGDRFDNIYVIAYVRDQPSYVCSLYSTALRAGSCQSFEAFVDQQKKAIKRYDYYGSFMLWSKVFGRENLALIPFRNDYFLKGDLLSDFSERVMPHIQMNELIKPKPSNQALTLAKLELLRSVNSVFGEKGRYSQESRQIRKLLTEYFDDSSDGEDTKLTLTGDMRKKITATFAKSNENFYSYFFKGEDVFRL